MGSRKLRLARTNEELIDAFKQVLYEVKMLGYCGSRLPPYEEPSNNDFAVMMESFLIHVRNLDDFFYGLERVKKDGKIKYAQPNDIIVEDFFKDITTWGKFPENQLSQEEIDKINKQLAHVSYKRTISSRDTWDFKSIQERLLWMFNEFISIAPIVTHHPELFEEFEDPSEGNYFYP